MDPTRAEEADPGLPLDGTVKGSNFVHQGFHDLLAMLPTGSGTGASAFFASTPGNTIDRDQQLYTQDYFAGPSVDPQSPERTPGDAENATGRAEAQPRAEPEDSGRTRHRDADHQPALQTSPLMAPATASTFQALRLKSTPVSTLPVSPVSAQSPNSANPHHDQRSPRRIPVPAGFPLRPASTRVRPPMSPPLSSALAVFASHSPRNEGQHPLQYSRPKATDRTGGLAPITAATPRPKYNMSPERVEGKVHGAPRLWALSPMKMTGGQTGAIKSPRSNMSPGKIDKRLVSWPMDFRHVVHASDSEEAQFLLMRWAIDGMGKVADPGWANYMKLLVRQRAADQQARAIAQSIIAREHGARQVTPFQTLKVVNGLPSSVYTPTEGSGSPRGPIPHWYSASRLTPGIRSNPSAKSPFNQIPNPFESAFSPPSSHPVSDDEGVESHDIIIGASPIAPLRVKARKPVPPLVTSQLQLRQPLTVAPEDIDGMPFPSTPTLVRDETHILTVNEGVSSGIFDQEQQMVNQTFTSRIVRPSLPTLEKAASIAIFFETLYHALLKPPPTLQAAHPDNYICARERRRLALEDEMEKRQLSVVEMNVVRQRWVEAETSNLREKRRRVGLNSFAKMKVIGHGESCAFGVVSLVKEKETGNLYAMKELRKSDMLRKGQEGHVRAEKDLLAAAANAVDATSRWIVKLHYSFQDVDRLYLVLDFEGGGDLLNLLVERDTFDEDFTKFYVAEMILALEATHKLGFIHRDVKPDNFLFSKDGHLKISDFGLANSLHWAYDTAYYEQQRRALLKRHGIDLEEPTKVKIRTIKQREMEAVMTQEWRNQGQGVLTWRDNKRRRMAFSVCGTNSYMSPEVIRGMGYGFSCDWWSLGVIAFECLYGYPPFVSNSRHLTRQKILNWRNTLRFPTKPRLSRGCADFLTKLLCEPEDRLGSMATSSTNRPNSMMLSERNAGFVSTSRNAAAKVGLGDDGTAEIKAHPWFKMIDWDNLHLQVAPYQPNLRNEADTSHFEDNIADEPLIAAGGAPADATRDPMLADKAHGGHLLELRKGMAFAGWTYKANKQNIQKQFGELLGNAEPAENTVDADDMATENDSLKHVATRSRALSL